MFIGYHWADWWPHLFYSSCSGNYSGSFTNIQHWIENKDKVTSDDWAGDEFILWRAFKTLNAMPLLLDCNLMGYFCDIVNPLLLFRLSSGSGSLQRCWAWWHRPQYIIGPWKVRHCIYCLWSWFLIWIAYLSLIILFQYSLNILYFILPGDSAPVKVFERTANLSNNQIINYRCDPTEKWLILIGIAPGSAEVSGSVVNCILCTQLYCNHVDVFLELVECAKWHFYQCC